MNIKDIPVTNNIDYDSHLDNIENSEYVYQFQPIEDEEFAVIMTVGKTMKHSDVLVNSFKYKNKLQCYLVSCLYTKEELLDIQSTCIFPLIRLNVKTTNKKELYILQYNFHMFDHMKSNKSIFDFVSNSNSDKVKVKGFYSITYHKNNKMVYLHKFKIALSHTHMLDKIIKEFVSTYSKNIID